MNLLQFKEAIGAEKWAEASLFSVPPNTDEDVLIVDLAHGGESISSPTSTHIKEAMDWVLAGEPEDERAILLEKALAKNSQETLAICFLQLGIFGDGNLSTEFQLTEKVDGTWIARNFWKDFTREEAGEVSALFTYYLETAQALRSMSHWAPVVLPETN